MPRDEETREGQGPANDNDLFELGQDKPTEGDFEYEEDQVNLVADFKKHPEGRSALKRLAEQCLGDFEAAWEATDKFRKNMADIWKLFSGVLDPKAPPFENMANAHVPILMENTIRMAHRQAYELFGNWTTSAPRSCCLSMATGRFESASKTSSDRWVIEDCSSSICLETSRVTATGTRSDGVIVTKF
jgi:hypothetical protein